MAFDPTKPKICIGRVNTSNDILKQVITAEQLAADSIRRKEAEDIGLKVTEHWDRLSKTDKNAISTAVLRGENKANTERAKSLKEQA